MQKKGKLVVISGPSGVGKGTLAEQVLKRVPCLVYAISATTRPARSGEKSKKNYVFLDKEEFLERANSGLFLEWAEVYGNYYGTPKKQVRDSLVQGYDVLLELDVQGACQVKEIVPEAILIFITPPSFEELRARLEGRGTEATQDLMLRLKTVNEEMKKIDQFDHVVVNDEVGKAVQEIAEIIEKN